MNIKQKTALCRWENKKETLTVGDLFEMHCEWPLTKVLSQPVRIEFPVASSTESSSSLKAEGSISVPTPYALVIVDTSILVPGRGIFKVTGYQPGSYDSSLKLVSKAGEVETAPLTWTVQSVIKEQQVKPFPAYGPWIEPLPFWYFPFISLLLLYVCSFVALKIRFIIRKKRKIREVKRRVKQKQALRIFITYLGGHKESQVEDLNKHFCLFLENCFFIYALNEKPEKILQQIKRHYPSVYKKSGKEIRSFFLEIKNLSEEKVSVEVLESLVDMARTVAIELSEQTTR